MDQSGMTLETARNLSTILAPFLPYLIKGLKVIGREAAPVAGKAIGEKIPDAVKAIWNRLQPKVKEQPAVQEAIEHAASKPEDEAVQQNLQASLATLLDDPKFRKEIAGLVAAAEKDESVIQVIQKVGKQKGRMTGVRVGSGDQLKKTGAKKVVVKQEIEDNTGTTVGFQIGKLEVGRKPRAQSSKVTVTHGDYIAGDQNKVAVNGPISGSTVTVGTDNVVNTPAPNQASLADLVALVKEMRALLPQARLEPDEREVVDADFKVLEAQVAKPEPKKTLVLPKLKSIAEVLGSAVAAGEAVSKLMPMLNQAIQWATQLLK